MHAAGEMFASFEFALYKPLTTTLAVRCHASSCFRIGSKFRCIRSTPTEMQLISENDFECFARTGVESPADAMFEQTNKK
jgi:hypothetical protein